MDSKHCHLPHGIHSKLRLKTSFILSGAERGLQARLNFWIVTWPEITQALPTFGNLVPEGTARVAAAAWRQKKIDHRKEMFGSQTTMFYRFVGQSRFETEPGSELLQGKARH